MHADEADFVEGRHGAAYLPSLHLLGRTRHERDDEIHRVVAEDAHARVAHDLSSRDGIWQWSGEEGEDRLGDPGAVDVDPVKHDVIVFELFIFSKIILWFSLSFSKCNLAEYK